jgi:prepilin-type N-terminal cleavage/methylation domain-containing protein
LVCLLSKLNFATFVEEKFSMFRRSYFPVRKGLTLVELVVVVAILAVLAAMVIPRLDFLKTQAEHAASAGTQADLGTMIQTFKASSGFYPSFDLLVDTGGSLYSKLQSQTTAAFLETWTVPGASNGSWYRSLSEAGFQYAYRHNPSATDASASGTTTVDVIGEASNGALTMAAIKSTGGDLSQLGATIRNTIYPGGTTYTPASNGPDGIAGNDDDVAAASTPFGVGEIPANKKLVVVGIGPKSSLLGKVMVAAPVSPMTTDDSKSTYCRYLAVFEVSSDGTAAKLKMVTDHRGRQIGARIDQYKSNSAVN